jgi:hypothetical protein
MVPCDYYTCWSLDIHGGIVLMQSMIVWLLAVVGLSRGEWQPRELASYHLMFEGPTLAIFRTTPF